MNRLGNEFPKDSASFKPDQEAKQSKYEHFKQLPFLFSMVAL